jgi:hypothetical protein
MGTTRRTTFVLVLLVALGVQGRWSFRSPEPYPAIRLPPFDYATQEDGTFKVGKTRITVAFADGTDAQVGTADLMSDFPFSTSGATLAHVFGTAAPDPPAEVRSWLGRQVAGLDPGSAPTTVTFCFQDADLDVPAVELVHVTPCRLRTVELP